MSGVVVVGAGPGIGAACARRFGREGHTVALVARSRERLEALAGELDGEGVTATVHAADAGDGPSLTAAFAQIRAAHGDPAILIYNAFSYLPGRPSRLDVNAFESAVASSATGALRSVHEVLPAMRAKKEGTLLLTGGLLALEPMPAFSAVGVAKAAQRNLWLALAAELTSEGINVSTVTVAGFVKSESNLTPEMVADEHWRLANAPQADWQAEVIFKGGA